MDFANLLGESGKYVTLEKQLGGKEEPTYPLVSVVQGDLLLVLHFHVPAFLVYQVWKSIGFSVHWKLFL